MLILYARRTNYMLIMYDLRTKYMLIMYALIKFTRSEPTKTESFAGIEIESKEVSISK